MRPTGVYGQSPFDGPHKWSELIDAYLAGEAIEPRFGTEVHGRDVAAAVQLALEAPAEAVAGKVFNVCDLALDRHDLLALVKAETGCPHPLPPRADRSLYNMADATRLRKLRWKPGREALLQKIVSAITAP